MSAIVTIDDASRGLELAGQLASPDQALDFRDVQLPLT